MFCFQCQEASKGVGCTIKGVCGKEASTAMYLDLLKFVAKGISIVTTAFRAQGEAVSKEANHWVTTALFTAITNANFDDEAIKERIGAGIVLRNKLIQEAQNKGIELPQVEAITWAGAEETYAEQAKKVGVLSEAHEDLRSLKELVINGLMGMAAYLDHAERLGFEDEACHAFTQEALSDITVKSLGADELTALVMKTGEFGVHAMALLDKANTTKYGHPEMTKVNIGVGTRPGILISGHDLHDMEDLLKQTEGTGVDVYTHSEMLPAHYYPAFKKYKHFVGNYGNAWWQQREEFTSFNGPIVFTTNCIVPPLKTSTYKDRMFTSNATGLPLAVSTFLQIAKGIRIIARLSH